jgi:hypothetical protein
LEILKQKWRFEEVRNFDDADEDSEEIFLATMSGIRL